MVNSTMVGKTTFFHTGPSSPCSCRISEVNGQLLGTATSQFIRYSFDLDPSRSQNSLEVIFDQSIQAGCSKLSHGTPNKSCGILWKDMKRCSKVVLNHFTHVVWWLLHVTTNIYLVYWESAESPGGWTLHGIFRRVGLGTLHQHLSGRCKDLHLWHLETRLFGLYPQWLSFHHPCGAQGLLPGEISHQSAGGWRTWGL